MTVSLDDLQANGKIQLWRPLDAGQSVKRCLWLSTPTAKTIAELLASLGGDRAAALAQDLSAFAMGRLLAVPGKLARLKPPGNEIWELKSRRPLPELRLLGAFIGRDEFVVLQAGPRSSYDHGGWRPAIKEVEREWARLFGTTPRRSGIMLEDYVTNTDPDGGTPVPQ